MEYELSDLPPELSSRVRAATGKPEFLTLHCTDDEWLVEALTGDRVTLMRLALDDNRSVAEVTDSFTFTDIEEVTAGFDARVTVADRNGVRSLPLSEQLARVVAERLHRGGNGGATA